MSGEGLKRIALSVASDLGIFEGVVAEDRMPPGPQPGWARYVHGDLFDAERAARLKAEEERDELEEERDDLLQAAEEGASEAVLRQRDRWLGRATSLEAELRAAEERARVAEGEGYQRGLREAHERVVGMGIREPQDPWERGWTAGAEDAAGNIAALRSLAPDAPTEETGHDGE